MICPCCNLRECDPDYVHGCEPCIRKFMMAGKPDFELHHLMRKVRVTRTKTNADGTISQGVTNTGAAVYRMDLNPRHSQQRSVGPENGSWENAVRLLEDQ